MLYTIGSPAIGLYLQGTNLSAGTPSKKTFGATISNVYGILLGTVPAPYIYATLLKTFPKEKVLSIIMRFLLVGVIFNFFIIIFKCKEYPQKKEEKPVIELNEK